LSGLTTPVQASAAKPSMVTPEASAHCRIRVQSPMATMSLTAPMVQKPVRWVMAPNASPMEKALQSTRWVREAREASVMAADSRGPANQA
jgi:hypothetical protein